MKKFICLLGIITLGGCYYINDDMEETLKTNLENCPTGFKWNGENCHECLPGYYGAECENTCQCSPLETCNDGRMGNGDCNCPYNSIGGCRCYSYQLATPNNCYSCHKIDPDFNTANCQITDSRDGQKYKVVSIHDKLWLAENIKFAGSSITPNIYNENYFYTYEDAKSVCPTGWRLPTAQDYIDLINDIGKIDNYYLKDRNDTYGFGAVETGYFNAETGLLQSYSTVSFWTIDNGPLPYEYQTEDSESEGGVDKKAIIFTLNWANTGVGLSEDFAENSHTVRCVQN